MQPNQQNQQQNNPGNQPTSNPGGGPDGAWDFLYNQPDSPKKESFFSRYKKLIIIAGSAFVLLIVLGIVASLSSNGSSTTKTSSLEVPTTTVSTTAYDGKYFSMSYASSLKINADEVLEDEEGWFLQLADDPELPAYDIAVRVSSEVSPYADSEEGVRELIDPGNQPNNVVTTDVLLAGEPTKKSVGEFTNDLDDVYLVYTSAQIGDKYITVSGMYSRSNQEINDSFDAMIGSIKLK